MTDKTPSDELSAALAKVAELEAKLAEAANADTEARIAAAKAEAEAAGAAAVAELQAQLDASVLEATAAQTALAELTAFLEAAEAARVEAEAVAARKEERLAQVKEAASFPEAYLEANADRFAAMSDEQFEVTLEGFKAQAEALGAAGAPAAAEIPPTTAMTAARSEPATASDPLTAVLALRGAGIDVTTV